MSTSWYLSFRCIAIRERELKKNKDMIAIIRSEVPEKITLRPNKSINVKGNMDREMQYPHTSAIINECEESNLPSYVDICNQLQIQR